MKASRLSIICVMLLVGCTHHYSRIELTGAYTLKVGHGTGILVLKSDGSYIHTFQRSGGSSTTAEGHWKLESLDAGPTVALDDFHRLPGEVSGGAGYYLLPIESFFGEICLMTNEDNNECYVKRR